METTSGRQRAGLVLAGVLSAINIPSVFTPTPDGEVGPPFGVLVLGTVLGVIGLVAVVLAWRGNRGALRVAAGALVINLLTALPAFFVDVPAWIKLAVGLSVLATVARDRADVLRCPPSRRGPGLRPAMIAVVTILLAFPAGYLLRSRLAAMTTYAVAYLWAFTFQTLYLVLDSLGGGSSPAFEAGEFPWEYGVVTLAVLGVGFALVEAGHRLARRRRSSVVVAAQPSGEPARTSRPYDEQGPPERVRRALLWCGGSVRRWSGGSGPRHPAPDRHRGAPATATPGRRWRAAPPGAGWADRAGWAGACVSSVVGGPAEGFASASRACSAAAPAPPGSARTPGLVVAVVSPAVSDWSPGCSRTRPRAAGAPGSAPLWSGSHIGVRRAVLVRLGRERRSWSSCAAPDWRRRQASSGAADRPGTARRRRRGSSSSPAGTAGHPRRWPEATVQSSVSTRVCGKSATTRVVHRPEHADLVLLERRGLLRADDGGVLDRLGPRVLVDHGLVVGGVVGDDPLVDLRPALTGRRAGQPVGRLGRASRPGPDGSPRCCGPATRGTTGAVRGAGAVERGPSPAPRHWWPATTRG